MLDTTLLGFITVLFAFLSKYKNVRWGLEVSMILIFLFLAFRYNFGNDYRAYHEFYIEINKARTIEFRNITSQFEFGWIYLNRLFKPLGFFAMVAFLSAFHCYVIYRFIKKYVPKDYYWVAIFFYVFNTTFLLVLSSAMRQSVAITLFIIAIDFIYKRRIIPYLALIGVASFFHTSALILIPVYLLAYVKWKITTPYFILIISLFISLFLYKEMLSTHLNSVVETYFTKYEAYQGGVELGTGFGMLFSILMLIITILKEKYQSADKSLLFKIAIISFLFIPLGFIIGMVGRVGMYFAPATIATYPLIFTNIKNPYFRFGLLFMLMFMSVYSFIHFFNSETWNEGFGNYNTIFSSP